MRLLQRIIIILFVLAVLLYGGTKFYNTKYVDRIAPVIGFSDNKELQVSILAPKEDLLKGVTATDNRDGDLSAQVSIKSVSPLISADTAKVYYVVFDKANNMGTASRIIRYTDYEKPEFSLDEALIFAPGDSITFLNRLKAFDVVDGDISDKIRVTMKTSTEYEGEINTTVQVTNSMGDNAILPLRVIISNAGANFQPIKLTKYIEYIDAGSSFDPSAYIDSAKDENGRDLSRGSVQITSDVNSAEAGNYLVNYSCEINSIPYNVYLTVVVK